MAEYCTVEDLDIWGISADATDDMSATEKIRPAIEAASDVADSYLRRRFTLPLLNWGNDLKRYVAMIAAYDLISSRGYSPKGNIGEDQLRLRYEDAIAWLRDVSRDNVTPDVTDSSSGSAPGVSSAKRPLVVSSSQRGWSGDGKIPFQGD